MVKNITLKLNSSQRPFDIGSNAYGGNVPEPDVKGTLRAKKSRQFDSNRLYAIKNKEKIKKYLKKYNRNKVLNDPLFRLKKQLRKALLMAVRSNAKKGKTVERLGCSIEEFKKYIESKFQVGMTWNNWGRKGWHLDHIISLSAFDLYNDKEILKACHYTNIQPLWAQDNLIKWKK